MLASYALNFTERSRRHFGLWKLRDTGISRMEQPEGGGGGRAPLPQISYFVLFLLSVAMPSIIYTERLFCFPANFSFFVSRSHLLSLCQLFFVSPGGASDIASRLYCLRSSTQSLKRPRPVASSNWICLYYGLFSFVLLNTTTSYCHYFRGAPVLLSIFLLFPAVFALKSCPVSFCFARRSLWYFRSFSIVLEPRILLFQPWAKQKKII